MIHLTGVTLRPPGPVAGRPLLDAIDLRLRPHEQVAVVGPNGAGKSLLLQVISGLRTPTEGTIRRTPIDASTDASTAGPVAAEDASAAPRIALVFQTPDDQIVGSTVERDLAFPLENRGVDPTEMRSRVEAALERSGLADRRQDPPHLLSEGEKQRLALATALLMEPRLLLLDEPTSRLDPAARARFLEEVDRARRESGVTVVLATHRSEEVMPADRVIGLREGRVEFDGTPAELLRSPDADRLSVRWSPLHRLRRGLIASGLSMDDETGADWNDANVLLERVGARSAR